MPQSTMNRPCEALVCRFGLSVVVVLIVMTLMGSPSAARSRLNLDTTATLRVMSFNIRNGSARDGENAWPQRRSAVIQVLIGDGSPDQPAWDLVGLQEAEASQLDEILAAIPGYLMIGVGRDDGARKGEFAAILYRPDRLNPQATGTRWLSETPEAPGSTGWGNTIPRIMTWGEFARTGVKKHPPFLVINTHLDHASAHSREASAAAISEWSRRQKWLLTPRIVMGDFNAGLTSPPMRWLREDAGLTDSWQTLHRTASEPATYCGWNTTARPDKKLGPKIDAILIDHHWRPLQAEIDRRVSPEGRTPSDHYPVTATLELNREDAD